MGIYFHTCLKFRLVVLPVTLMLWIPMSVKASEPDTLQLKGHLLTDGLADAHSMYILQPNELVISESGADRFASYHVQFQTTVNEDNELEVIKIDSDNTDDEVLNTPGLNQPGAFTVILDTYYAVINKGSGRILLLDEERNVIRYLNVPSWILNGTALVPKDITSTEIGELYLLDSRNRKIYHFNSNGDYLQYFELPELERPNALMFADESLFVSDGDSGTVHILTGSGHRLATIGSFPELSRVRVLDRRIWIISGSVLHLFDIFGDHKGNWKLSDSDQPIRDIAWVENQLFILTPGSLYYSDSINHQNQQNRK